MHVHILHSFTLYSLKVYDCTNQQLITVWNIPSQMDAAKWKYSYIIRLTVTPHKVVNLTLIRGHVQHPPGVIVNTL